MELQKANRQPGWKWSQTKPLRNSHLGRYETRVWSRRVSSQWVPGTTREILVWFCWVAPHPWHHRRNYTLYECLSPSVYYKNHRAPTSPRRSENRPEQSVKCSTGKPVMTTSGSIWLSVGREMAQRETETTVGNRKELQDYCRWVFVFHSWFSLLFFFSQATERKNVWCGCHCTWSEWSSSSWKWKYVDPTKEKYDRLTDLQRLN